MYLILSMRPVLKTIFIIICFLCCCSVFGQNTRIIDSLFNIIKTQPEDTVKVNTLNELAWELSKTDAARAKTYAEQAITLSETLTFEKGRRTSWVRLGQIANTQKEYEKAEKIWLEVLEVEQKVNDQYGIGRAQSALSEIYINKSDLKKALDYGLEALNLYETINDERNIALIANKLGIIYQKMGSYDKAPFYFFKGLEIREKLGYQGSIGVSCLDIGIFYNKLENYDKAKQYLEKSEAIFEKLNNPYNLAKVYNNLGIVHFNLNYYNRALKNYQKALSLKKQLGLEDKDPGIYNNIGTIYYKKDELDKALEYYLKSIAIHKETTGGKLFIDSYINVSDIYYTKEDYESAADHYHEALRLAESSNKKDLQLTALSGLSDSYAKLQQYNTALQYNNRYIKLNKKIKDEEARKLAADYEKDKEIADANLEKEKANSEKERAKIERKNTFITSLIIVLALALFLFFAILYGNKQKQKARLAEKNRQLGQQKIEELLKTQELKSMNAMIEGQEEERKRIARDLHDRLGSMLAMVKIHYKSVEENIENLRTDNKKQYEKANDLLDTACEEVRKIAHNMTSGVLMKFGLVAALEDLKEKLEQTRKIKIDFIAHGLDNRLENDVEITLYRIVQELISNILKHAGAKEITIQLLRSDQGLNVVVEDDGIGFDTRTKKDPGMGLKNVASRVDKLNGEFTIDSTSGNGTTVTIDIPLTNT